MLTLALDGVRPGDSVGVQVNGLRLSRSDDPGGVSDAGDDSTQVHWDVPADAVSLGDNTLTVWIDERSPQTRDAVTLSEAWLQVTYR